MSEIVKRLRQKAAIMSVPVRWCLQRTSLGRLLRSVPPPDPEPEEAGDNQTDSPDAYCPKGPGCDIVQCFVLAADEGSDQDG
jgi:hypothetical protein